MEQALRCLGGDQEEPGRAEGHPVALLERVEQRRLGRAVATVFQLRQFRGDFWGTPSLGAIFDQVKSTMLVTLWVFIGIEGASVVSGRAADRKDIGRATILGFLIALCVYLLVSLLSFGVMAQADLAALPAAASMANVLESVVGPWGSVLVRIGLVISVLGAFLSWTLFAAEIPYRAAQEGMLPAVFAAENANGSRPGRLWITN
ncbi:amino acid permease [bacterium]|nr:amino acid permease [bacterium]